MPQQEDRVKYLILEDFAGHPVSVLFPRRVDHVEMRDQLPYGQVLSAGFVELENGALRCFGGSVELDAKAGENDPDIIANALRPRPESAPE
jgi:hypothetical protein